jgi:DNA-binding HxlR family transcriptional regulator
MACPGDVYAADCSARDALALISGKWVMLLLPALAQGPLRNGALLRKIEGISQKVLTQTLRQLERNGLVERCDLGSKPLHVEYRLTEVARGLVDTLSALTAGPSTTSRRWTPPASASTRASGACTAPGVQCGPGGHPGPADTREPP